MERKKDRFFSKTSDVAVRGLPVSLVLHLLAVSAFLVPFSLKRSPAPLDERVPVEIWTPEQWDELLAPERPQGANEPPPQYEPGIATALEGRVDPVPSAPEPPPVEPKSQNPGTIRATKILSGDVLSHPESRAMRKMLPLLEEETRMEQLCGLEAMAQIVAAFTRFQPDRVVAYAMADVKIGKTTVLADGAAFRSHQQWYNLKFTCQLKADRQTVQAFEFLVGEAIPKKLWEAHNLPAIY